MTKNRKIDHIGLVVQNFESAVKWYQDILEFSIKGKFSSLFGMEFYYIENNGTVYEIYEDRSLSGSARGKIDHIAYESEDIKKDYEYFKNNGCKFATGGIGYVDFTWENGVDFFMIVSDTGEIIEFCQKR